MVEHNVPDGLPVLSRGRHRSPRKGACFMEMASVLANEPWSDHPRCTHPLVAHLARMVNDNTTDENRGDLAPLIPSVVGLHGGGLAWTVDVTAAVALQAIPDAPEHSQRALAAGLIRCEELSATLEPGAVRAADAVRQALDRVPGAVAWARQFIGDSTLSPKQFQKRSAPSVIRCAVLGLAASANPYPDGLLRDLLRVGIAAATRSEPQPSDAPLRVAPARLGQLGTEPVLEREVVPRS
jgi:hypothetical protein